jgi:hypothetical protein
MNHYPGHGLISSIAKLAQPYIILGRSEMPGFSSNLIKPQLSASFTGFLERLECHGKERVFNTKRDEKAVLVRVFSNLKSEGSDPVESPEG